MAVWAGAVMSVGAAADLAGDLYEVTTEDLIVRSSFYDEKRVVLQGEVIGNVLNRPGHAWLNIKDSYGLIGIWAPAGLTEEINFHGSYRYRGDVVQISGTFHRADPRAGGDACVRADKIDLIKRGFQTPHSLSSSKVTLAWSMFAIALFLMFLRLALPMKERANKK